ncbi:MAG: CDP-glucose 4,6-dehydratase [Acidobacteria bacterium]|nr:CDP-glucose 4,6-dehydratase [Acidobacteriota bacterium]
MSLSRDFWKGRRVFLTGHTGFKGSWLSLWLSTLGADLVGYALEPPTTPSLYQQAGVDADLHSIIGDIRDFPKLSAAIAEFKPDVVLHLAAQSVVRTGYEDPIGTYSSNVMGTVNLLEAVRLLKRKCVVVNVTSDKCYDNREWAWGYREIDPMGGHDPYSNSKGCAELVTSAYRDSYFPPEAYQHHGVALASARAGNAIGGGDWTAFQLIPDLMRAFMEGQPCLIRNPLSYRPWQFVLEPLRGYLLLAERLSENGADFASGWNFGPLDEDARPVSWIADTLKSKWGRGASWRQDSAAAAKEARALKLDVSKAADGLAWRPALRLEQTLSWIVEWYKAFEKGDNLRSTTLEQIQSYERLLQGLPQSERIEDLSLHAG